MKKMFSLITVIFISFYSFSQNQTIDQSNFLNYYEIQNNRVNFFHVDDKYQIQKDTIYYIDHAEFIINIGWDSVKIGDDWYIVLTYPNYKGAKQNTPPYLLLTAEDLQKNLYTELKNGKIGKKRLKEIADSITIIDKEIQGVLKKQIAHKGQTPNVTSSGNENTDLIKDVSKWVRTPLVGINDLKLLIKRDDFIKLTLTPVYSTALRRIVFSSGQLTVPFKLRPSTQDKAFSMTTDVTLGAYVGIKRRISSKQNFFVTLPVLLGLTFVNVNDNTTTTTSSTTSGVYPGWTFATGFVFQLNSVDIGIVTGWDFASQVGKGWIYQGKNWVSFAIGYSFLK